MENETWKSVPGWEDYYIVSDKGNIRRCSRIKPRITNGGYETFSPTAPDKKQSYKFIHRAVAEAFIGPPPTPNHVVNHKNGIKTDNRLENLEWVTHSENIKHAYRTGLKSGSKGSANKASKITEDDVREILRLIANRVNQTEIAQMYGVSRRIISHISTGSRWSHVERPAEIVNKKIHGSEVLYEAEVVEIKRLLSEGNLSKRAIADAFKVTEGTIRAIANGKTWTHIT